MATSSTSFLLFLRVRTVYLKSTAVTAPFGTLWLASVVLNIFTVASRGQRSVAAQLFIPLAHSNSNLLDVPSLPISSYIFLVPIKYAILPSMSTFRNDISIFLAISYRLTADAVAGRGWRARLLSIFKGEGLYSLSKSLLQSGQVYFW